MNELARLTLRRKEIMFDLEAAERDLDRIAALVENLRSDRDAVNHSIRSIVDRMSIERAARLFARDAVEMEVVG